MELITNIVIEYLKHNKRIVVPKLGAFIVKQPSGMIIFSELMRNDDGVLRSLLMAYGVKELEANGKIDRFVFEIRHAIGNGNSFTVDNLGEFLPGHNNTITFKQKREPQHIGGNIKPPIETLTTEKRRLKRQVQAHSKTHRGDMQPRTSTPLQRKATESDTTSNISKPDAYLRGLKYDKDKNKKRNDDGRRSDSRKRGGLAVLFQLIIVLAVAASVVWFLWQWLNSDNATANAGYDTTATDVSYMPCDSLQIIPADTMLLNIEGIDQPQEGLGDEVLPEN